MHDDSKKVKARIIAGAPTLIITMIMFTFVSDVNIFDKANGNTGVFVGGLFSIFLLLVPLGYIRIKNIKVKNPKPLFVEPSGVALVPISFLATALIFFMFILIVAIPQFSFILGEIERDTFIGSFIMTCVILFSLFGHMIVYGLYIHTHYTRVIEYNTPEWKKIRADRKAAKRL